VVRDPFEQRLSSTRDQSGVDSALLRALLQDGSVAFALHAPDGRYRQVSRALAELNGVTVAEHLDRLPGEVLPTELGAQIETAVARVLADGRSHREPEQRAAAQWGHGLRFLDTHWSAVRDDRGGIIGALAIVHDVTDRHRIADLLGSTQSPWPNTQSARTLPAQRAHQVAEEERWERRTAVWPPLLAAAVRAGRPCYLPDRAAVRAAFPESAHWPEPPEAEQAWAVLPLVVAAGPMGGLLLVYGSERAFDEDDQAYLQALVGQCTLAVARARMHEREHRQVVSLQDALLPKRLPDLAGVEAAFRYIPGSLDTEVGGDWYDLFGFPDGRLGMVVGDVIGKGVTAAAGMGRVRAALRALAFTDPSPRAVLTGLDRLFDATENAESLTTVVYAVFDPAAGTLLMSDAGHLPLLVLPADGEARYVDATPEATPLGWSEQRVEHQMSLCPGDIVLGFSDGLVETRAASLDDGLERLRRAADSAPVTALEPLLDHLVDAMLREHDQGDDVTVLAVRVRL
jgi:PAS domain S-box-containing protein